MQNPPPSFLALLAGILCLLWSGCAGGPPLKPLHSDDRPDSLARFVRDQRPWVHMPANSEQCQPVYIGATPREIDLGLRPADGGKLRLVDTLRGRLEEQTRELRQALIKRKNIRAADVVEFEAWPVRDDLGEPNWAYARWRPKGDASWRWFDAGLLPTGSAGRKAPILPISPDLKNKKDFALVFDDILKLKQLYDKPLFGDCIWIDPDRQDQIIGAWLPLKGMESWRNKLSRRLEHGQNIPTCRAIPQPSRWNGRPATFVLTVGSSGVKWPREFEWKPARTDLPAAAALPPQIHSWPHNFVAGYRSDILALDGEKVAIFPLSRRTAKFTRKNSIEPDNQLRDMVSFLEERYRQLGIHTRRQEFSWRGIPQANLIAVIPGTGEDRKPVVMADHIDTAFCEDVFDKNGQRVSAPGADDNLSATAVLLRAAEVLRGRKFRHDIWLVHLTGEEFPADDLGARHFVGRLLRDRQDIAGLVLMDMIGHREGTGDKIFQVNAGDDKTSLRMAKIAIDASAGTTRFQPVLRTRYDPRSYLYNTDGLIFAEAGFPVVYFNEHINRLENFYRKGYHHTTDASGKMDWNYATDVGKVAIQAAAAMAEQPSR